MATFSSHAIPQQHLGNEHILEAEMDAVFERAVAARPPVIFAPPCLDSTYEVDLSGLPIPVARAAVRWALRRVLLRRGVLRRDLPLPFDDDDDAAEADSGVDDVDDESKDRDSDDSREGFGMIGPESGVPRGGEHPPTIIDVAQPADGNGKGEKLRRKMREGSDKCKDLVFISGFGVARKHADMEGISLQDYVVRMLKSEFAPSLEPKVPEATKGVVVVNRKVLDKWVAHQRSCPTLV